MIKARFIKLSGKGNVQAAKHLKYIQRDGAGRGGEPGKLYDALTDEADGAAFNDRCEGDRHQFRFIVSPEDAARLDDLKSFTRNLMTQVEKDLGTKLDWVGVDHHNTGHPHSHIVIRGKDDQGNDLVIARDYISHGVRERAEELVTLELGPETERERRERLKREVTQERFTSIDRRLLQEVTFGVIDMRTDEQDKESRLDKAFKIGRLQKLERMGLAQQISPALWQPSGSMEETLRRMGERGDIIKTLHRAMRGEGIERGARDHSIYDPVVMAGRPLVGRVLDVGFSDEITDRHYLIVDGVDGRSHYIDMGHHDDLSELRRGSIVQITARSAEPRATDRTVAEIAAGNGGIYSPDAHLAQDDKASPAFSQAHVRRLEALRRGANIVARRADGTWEIPDDFLEKAGAFEQSQSKRWPVDVRVESSLAIEKQVGATGSTWLDTQLVGRDKVPIRDLGFGRNVRQALDARRTYLVAEGLAEQRGTWFRFERNLLLTLRRRELQETSARIAGETGLNYRELGDRDHVEGIYRRPVQLASGKFALIEGSREFSLVPWRPVLERNRDKQVYGLVRGQSISWGLTRARGRNI
ncbi:MAG: DUF3363 domain-containing protein [Kiloniellales bacterium]|nr:DUF3363 domain-containing protein [Kiloniellales bacterium]